jgi:hypothetical protein
MTNEMKKVINELYEKVNYNPDDCCEFCPYYEQCCAEELYWGCGVWEDSMGEDL